MLKLTLRHTMVGLIFWAVSMLFAAAMLALLALVAQFIIPYNAVAAFIVGAVVAALFGFCLRRIIYFKPYYIEAELSTKDVWAQQLSVGPVKRGAAYCSLLPMLALFSAPIITFALVFGDLNSATETAVYVYKSAICAALGGGAISPVIYVFLTVKSFVVCSNCKSVNCLIYDEELGYETAGGIVGSSYNYGGSRGGQKVWGGGYNSFKVSNSADRALCHCKHCGAKNVSTQVYKK